MYNEKMDKLKSLAKQNHLVLIKYQKTAIDIDPPHRLIEPYSLTQGKQDIMLRAYQILPEEGWRYFMFHKIIAIDDGNADFTPRRKMTFIEGFITYTYEPCEAWNNSAQNYRNMILDCLADMKITLEEKTKIENFKRAHNITPEQIRSIHASIFANCLNHILSDGIIEDNEQSQLNILNQCLIDCGGGIVD